MPGALFIRRTRELNHSVDDDHFLLLASEDFKLMCATTESCLRKMGFHFIQNKTKDLMEFEVETPACFRIVIQRRNDPEVGNFIMPSIKIARGTFLDIWLCGDEDEHRSTECRAYARQFLISLVSLLPEFPWEGLKFQESRRARKKWKDALG